MKRPSILGGASRILGEHGIQISLYPPAEAVIHEGMTPHFYPAGSGWIEVIAGCMFSGKTELLRRINRARIARQEVLVFKPAVDSRYAETEVVTHNDVRIPCVPIKDTTQILDRVGTPSSWVSMKHSF